MGNGSTVKKDYQVSKGYICIKDYDDRNGHFWFFLEPLNGWTDDEIFFYVKMLPGGEYEVTGEWRNFYRKDVLDAHLRDLRKKLSDKTVRYYFIDDTGQVIRKEK